MKLRDKREVIEIIDPSIRYELDCQTLEDIEKYFDQVRKKYTQYFKIKLDIDDDSYAYGAEGFSIQLKGTRLETDEEVEKRIADRKKELACQKHNRLTAIKKERETYFRLKEKFEK